KRSAGGLQHRPQQRLYQLVSVGRRANLSLGKGQADDALHLSRIYRHRRRRASDEGRPVAVARGTILEFLLLERNQLSELLAEGKLPTRSSSNRKKTPPRRRRNRRRFASSGEIFSLGPVSYLLGLIERTTYFRYH